MVRLDHRRARTQDGLLLVVLVWSLRESVEEMPGCLRHPFRQERFVAVVVFFAEGVVRDVLSQRR